MPRISPKNWASFQHYKDRAPTWIKLHKGLLDDYEFQCLPVASRALAPMLWLLASEETDGSFDADPGKLAFRLRMTRDEVEAALKPLISSGFFIVMQDASTPLAEPERAAIPEKENKGQVTRLEQVQENSVLRTGADAPVEDVDLAGKPEWWPKRDRYGRVLGDVVEKTMFDVGKAVLGRTSGGQIVKLRKLYHGDLRSVTDLLLQADEKSNPAEWIAGVIRRGEVDELEQPKHKIFPEEIYRATA